VYTYRRVPNVQNVIANNLELFRLSCRKPLSIHFSSFIQFCEKHPMNNDVLDSSRVSYVGGRPIRPSDMEYLLRGPENVPTYDQDPVLHHRIIHAAADGRQAFSLVVEEMPDKPRVERSAACIDKGTRLQADGSRISSRKEDVQNETPGHAKSTITVSRISPGKNSVDHYTRVLALNIWTEE